MREFQVEFERLALANGWRGWVLTSCDDDGRAAGDSPLPNINAWEAWLSGLVGNPSKLAGYAVLKYSKTGEVCRALLPGVDGGREVVCKQSRRRGVRRVVGMFRKSRARRGYERALRLLAAGIHTAQPLALLERRFPSSEAWLVSEYIPDLVDLDHVALRHLAAIPRARLHAVKGHISTAVGELLEAMRAHDLSHRDLKAPNIMLTDWNGESDRPRVWLVDLDGLGGGGRRASRRREQLVRLASSLRSYKSVTRADYARFLKALPLGQDGASAWKSTYRELAFLVERYDTGSAAGKSHKIDGYSGDAEY
ncbi:MAG: lipopolysaccharide kinase InaA family protein [Phycisphaerae bacterium]|jgi:hypothetical protein